MTAGQRCKQHAGRSARERVSRTNNALHVLLNVTEFVAGRDVEGRHGL